MQHVNVLLYILLLIEIILLLKSAVEFTINTIQ